MRPARLILLLTFVALPGRAAVDPVGPGWQRIDVPATRSFFWRYVPESLDRTRPAPVVLFFHGAGSSPNPYRDLVSGAAERAGVVLALPRSSGIGWGTATDNQTVAETLRLLGEELAVDASRIAVAGHSAGGAYSFRLAFGDPRFSAAFSLASPFIAVALTDPTYTPPVRMYYSTGDPNFTGGSYARLRAQWQALGVPWEEEVRAGHGHGDWPPESMEAGFLFLATRSRPATGPGPCLRTAHTLCLGKGRFRVEVAWQTAGGSGPGSVVPLLPSDSGLFWFFGPANWEMLVKVIDGCPVNGRWWVFAAATTDVRYVLTVTDTATGRVRRYENPAGVSAPALTDTDAFPGCL